MKLRFLFPLAFMAVAFGASAQAIDSTNTRPVTVGDSPAGEAPLQSILDGLFGASWGTVLANQSTAGLWRTATALGTTIPTIVAEFSANSQINSFGIWFGTDASNVLAYDLLLGPAGAGSDAALAIQNGRIRVGSSDISACGIAINCSAGWITDARITPDRFGFFFRTAGQPIAYSIDSLNPGGEARVLAFQQSSSTNWAMAYEDIPLTAGSDRDYNDMVVKLESITPVPEPATIALMLAGLALLTFARRARG